MEEPVADRVKAAHEARSRHAWSEAVEHFKAADAEKPLGPSDLEAFAEAAEWGYHADLSLELYARSFAGYQPVLARLLRAWRSISRTPTITVAAGSDAPSNC